MAIDSILDNKNMLKCQLFYKNKNVFLRQLSHSIFRKKKENKNSA